MFCYLGRCFVRKGCKPDVADWLALHCVHIQVTLTDFAEVTGICANRKAPLAYLSVMSMLWSLRIFSRSSTSDTFSGRACFLAGLNVEVLSRSPHTKVETMDLFRSFTGIPNTWTAKCTASMKEVNEL